MFQADLVYDGTTLTVTLTDTQTGRSAIQRYMIDLGRALKATTAYAGFTAATAALAGNLDVLNWTLDLARALRPARLWPS